MYQKLKNQVFVTIHGSDKYDVRSRVFDIFIIMLIVLNVIMVIAETFSLPNRLSTAMYYIEIFSLAVFTVEYVLRLWTADLLFPDITPIKARVKYVFSFMAIIDLLAILPFYVPFLIPIDLRVLRTLRTVRLLRLFKVNRYTKAISTIANVFKEKSSQLLSSVFVVALLMLISSILMYNVEHNAQPDKFKNALSGLWWAVATFTTVGYGDIYPVTFAGKILSAIIALLGIALVAVPTGIISAGFIEQIEQNKDDDSPSVTYCPHCGNKIK